MKRFPPIVVALLMAIPLSLLCGRASADGVKARHVAADAKWYVHLDAEGAKKTAVFNQLLEIANAQFPVADVASQLKQAIGLNPLEDITGITVWNNSFEKDVAVVMIYAKVDGALLSNAVAQNADYKQIAYGKHTLHSWTDNNDGKTKTGAIWGDGVVLMGDKMDTLRLAIDVLDEKKPGGSALVKPAPRGAFLYAAVDGAQADDKNLSQLLSNAEAANACVFEDDGKINVQLNLTARTSEQANQLKALMDGVKAFAELGARELPTAQGLIRKMNVSVDGAKVMASFQHDSKTLIETLMKLDQENKAREGKRGIEKTAPPTEKPQGL